MVKCSLEMLLKYFQIRMTIVWQDTRSRANIFPAPTVASLAREIDCQFFNQSNPTICFSAAAGILFFYRKFFSQSNDGEVLGVFCEIVEGIIIFCLNVFSPNFLQPAESGTQSIFSVLRSWEKNWYSKNHSRSHFFSPNQSELPGWCSQSIL